MLGHESSSAPTYAAASGARSSSSRRRCSSSALRTCRGARSRGSMPAFARAQIREQETTQRNTEHEPIERTAHDQDSENLRRARAYDRSDTVATVEEIRRIVSPASRDTFSQFSTQLCAQVCRPVLQGHVARIASMKILRIYQRALAVACGAGAVASAAVGHCLQPMPVGTPRRNPAGRYQRNAAGAWASRSVTACAPIH